MKISTILDYIDSGFIALPKFQRGYVWNRDQVRALMDSLYRRHPIGSLLVWTTDSKGAAHKGDSSLPPGVVKLLLDGQQRMTTLYGIIRGRPPKFFDGRPNVLSGLFFNLDTEEFSYYMPSRMKDDPLWIDVTKLMQKGIGGFVTELSNHPTYASKLPLYINRLTQITGIKDVELHVEEVTGEDKTVDIVVDIFNQVNSGGTKLSKGDLALAKVCADWPEAREVMKKELERWREAGFNFDLEWLLRNVNTVLTGEARFTALHNVDPAAFKDGLNRAVKACDYLLNLISSRLGLDHDRVLFGRYAFPIMTHYVDRRVGKLETKEQDKLLFWYLHSALWGRFSGSTESILNHDLQVIEDVEGGIDRLIKELELWRGDLTVQPEHFGGWSLGARFYPMLYLLTRVENARDLCSGLTLKESLLGKMSRLEVHHIFPKALLYKHGYKKDQVNAVANFCLLTKDCNLEISNRDPAEYFPLCEARNPGALASQWIPTNPELWRVDNYLDFLEARKARLAEAANAFLVRLLYGERAPIEEVTPVATGRLLEPVAVPVGIPGGIESDEEERLIRECNNWVKSQGLPEGQFLYEIADPETGEPIAVLDLAWPNGLQEGLSEPVALLIDEGKETLEAANKAGFSYFTKIEDFKQYVKEEILVLEPRHKAPF